MCVQANDDVTPGFFQGPVQPGRDVAPGIIHNTDTQVWMRTGKGGNLRPGSIRGHAVSDDQFQIDPGESLRVDRFEQFAYGGLLIKQGIIMETEGMVGS